MTPRSSKEEKWMSRKNLLILSVSAVLTIALVILAAVLTAPTEGMAAEAKPEPAGESAENIASSEKEAAEGLIGKTVSREEIQTDVGNWEKFEMSSQGCERGVYAGKFYYKDFMIFSRTYNKGKTFSVVSVN
jgi:hypothetical protein